jgi:redox-sensing transcriptional repressor
MTVNKQAIIRLSKYKSALNKLRALGFKKVYSDNLADSAGVTSAQVRKDFSMFEITGNKRGGYNVDDLLNKLNFVLGKDKIYDIIIVGVGNIGAALLKYKGFEKEGLRIVAGFDIDSLKINRELPVPILPIEEMSDFVKKNKIKIAIIATPELAAQEVLD